MRNRSWIGLVGIVRQGRTGDTIKLIFGYAKCAQSPGQPQAPVQIRKGRRKVAATAKSHRIAEPVEPLADHRRIECDHGGKH